MRGLAFTHRRWWLVMARRLVLASSQHQAHCVPRGNRRWHSVDTTSTRRARFERRLQHSETGMQLDSHNSARDTHIQPLPMHFAGAHSQSRCALVQAWLRVNEMQGPQTVHTCIATELEVTRNAVLMAQASRLSRRNSQRTMHGRVRNGSQGFGDASRTYRYARAVRRRCKVEAYGFRFRFDYPSGCRRVICRALSCAVGHGARG